MSSPESPPENPPARSWLLRVAVAVFAAVLLASALGFATARSDDPATDPTQLAAAMGTEARDLNHATTEVPTTRPAVPTPTPTTLPTTTTTEYQGPLPEPPPADPYAPTPQIVLGRIEIPKLGVVGNLQEGITLTAINRGPGHWPGTPMPGGVGNMTIAGHRTTYSKPFNRLDELVAGDHVNFFMPNGDIFVYEVRGVIIVPAANIGIATQNFAHTATLFACNPKGSATQRIVAKLKLLGPDNKPVDPEALLPPIDTGADPITGTTLLVRTNDDAPGSTGGGGGPLVGGEG